MRDERVRRWPTNQSLFNLYPEMFDEIVALEFQGLQMIDQQLAVSKRLVGIDISEFIGDVPIDFERGKQKTKDEGREIVRRT